MNGYLTYFFEQHKRLLLGYSVIFVIALILSLNTNTTTASVAVTILYISVFASLAPIASLNSDREIDQLLSMPGGRKNLVTAQYLNSVIAISASFVSAAIVTLLTLAFKHQAKLPSLPVICIVFAVTLYIIAIMQPLSMFFGRKGLLIGFAALMFILFQSIVRFLLTNGGAALIRYAVTNIEVLENTNIKIIIGDNIGIADAFNLPTLIISACTAVTLFVSSYIVARLVFGRKNFQVNKL